MKAATRLNQRDVSPLRISIHAAREGGDKIPTRPRPSSRISIHAAREGGDIYALIDDLEEFVISIHAAREGGDIKDGGTSVTVPRFQSTPPVKAATFCVQFRRLPEDISIHAAREGGDYLLCVLSVLCYISIHAAREGGDRIWYNLTIK